MKNLQRTGALGALLLSAAVLLGCGTSLGGILGDDGDRRSDDTPVYGDQLRGTVERVDTYARVIVVDSDGSSNNLRNGDGAVELRYDDDTTVRHQGRTYEVRDLEPGDRIVAELERSGSRLHAREIEVTYDVTQGDDTRDDRDSGADLRGTVRHVDRRDNVIELEPIGDDRGYGTGRDDLVVLHFDDSTPVEYEGRRYTAENLERGDEIEVEIRESGNRLIAEEIVVLRDSRTASRY